MNEKEFQEDLYRNYLSRFIGYVLKRRCSLQYCDAQEIAHNAFLNIFKYRNNIKNDAAFDSWMFKVLHNAMNQYVQRNYEKISAIKITLFENLHDNVLQDIPNYQEIEEELIKKKLENAIGRESAYKKHAYTIVKMYNQGYNCRDISEKIGLAYRHTKSIKQHAYKQLKNLLK